ncbi:hypothetical protein [Neobacillus fumarioli]|uniref:hypothetical protein n=1 Tax=Neobacillus fumarioli TaxID=105229 RepID=UPI00082AB35B|nr:hypothetical protein [Neobacillus fumarioli]
MENFSIIWSLVRDNPPEWTLLVRKDQDGRYDLDPDMFQELSEEEQIALLETERDLQEYAASVGYRFKHKVIWCSLPGDWKIKRNFEKVTVETVGEDWSHKLFGDMDDLVQAFVRSRSDVLQLYEVHDLSFEGAGSKRIPQQGRKENTE